MKVSVAGFNTSVGFPSWHQHSLMSCSSSGYFPPFWQHLQPDDMNENSEQLLGQAHDSDLISLLTAAVQLLLQNKRWNNVPRTADFKLLFFVSRALKM